MRIPVGGSNPVRQHKRRMREQGYDDGHAGRDARYLDADYQRSWRKGRSERTREGNA